MALYGPHQMGNADSKETESQRSNQARNMWGISTLTSAQVLKGEVAVGISVTAIVEYEELVKYYQSSILIRIRRITHHTTRCCGLQIYVVAAKGSLNLLV
jgi:hypothetical protein